jgi:putative flippase GtrA
MFSLVFGRRLVTVPRQMLRDLVKGAAGLAVNTAAIIVLVEVLDINPTVAPAISLSFIMVFAYLATDRWTFAELDSPETGIGHLKTFMSFSLAYVSGHAVKYTFYIVFISFLPYVVGWPLAAGSGFLISFVINRRIWL